MVKAFPAEMENREGKARVRPLVRAKVEAKEKVEAKIKVDLKEKQKTTNEHYLILDAKVVDSSHPFLASFVQRVVPEFANFTFEDLLHVVMVISVHYRIPQRAKIGRMVAVKMGISVSIPIMKTLMCTGEVKRATEHDLLAMIVALPVR